MKHHPEGAEIVKIVTENADTGKRVDVFLAERLDKVSRSRAAALTEQGLVTAGGLPLKKSDRLEEGVCVTVVLPPRAALSVMPEDILLNIVYEDDCLLVIDKEKGMVVHPAPGSESGTMVNALLFCCKELSSVNGGVRPGIVHRLDKDTSGLVAVAKTDAAHESLAGQIQAHTFERVYEAVVFGAYKEGAGRIDLPIGRSERDRKKMAVSENGRRGVTDFETLAVYSGRGAAYSHMRFALQTGRTHQIRVHTAYRGHPVAGDAAYGSPERDARFFRGLSGQCLHAKSVAFRHPESGREMRFEAGYPDYFLQVLTEMEKWDKIY